MKLTFYPGVLLTIFIIIPIFFSCKVSKPSYYFRDLQRDTVITSIQSNEALKIRRGDILNISISSLNKEEDAIFTLNEISSNTNTNVTTGYSIDKEGNIHLHKLGKIKAEGFTRTELEENLEKALLPYLKDPVVTINFTNHFITVIGEVGKPQLLNMPAEKLSIIDALAQSSNTTPAAQLSKLIVIRNKDEASKEIKHVSLEDHSIFNSQWYYLQPNDIVVVNPDEKRVSEELRRANYRQTSALIFQGLTIAIVLYQAFFKN